MRRFLPYIFLTIFCGIFLVVVGVYLLRPASTPRHKIAHVNLSATEAARAAIKQYNSMPPTTYQIVKVYGCTHLKKNLGGCIVLIANARGQAACAGITYSDIGKLTGMAQVSRKNCA